MRLEIGTQWPDIGLEDLQHPVFVSLKHASPAKDELRRSDDCFPIDDRQRAPVRVPFEPLLNRNDQGRVSRVQHVVEHDDPFRRHNGYGPLQIARKCIATVLPVDMKEP